MRQNNLLIYNSLHRQKELFRPIHPEHVGMYVCGTTVYGDGHLGHARPAITFDVLFRYLTHLGYKVRYVRNITDVGHLEHDADEGEDKIAKKARLEQLEPMEVVQMYLNRYHAAMERLNVLPPSIEPHASGHIIEQIQYIRRIIDAGYAYESNGSVYFDVPRYNADHHYGKLSGRNIDEKYLGDTFDIHGGGMDLKFPHHECEIAQTVAANSHESVHYWMHNNMITINGQKMGKSLGNFITLDEFFTGSHPLLEQPYAPMTIRFFILMAHYRSTVDFSNDALRDAEKAYDRMLAGWRRLASLKPSAESTVADEIAAVETACYEAMDDDLNTPITISHLFEAVGIINRINDGHATATAADIDRLRAIFQTFLFDIMGMRPDMEGAASGEAMKPYHDAVELLLQIRAEAKQKKDWATSDLIRDRLAAIGFAVKDTRDGGFEWSVK